MNEGQSGQATPRPDDSSWQYVSASQEQQRYAAGDMQPVPTDPIVDTEDISWTASEFIAHHKGPGWYSLMALIAVVLMVLVYVITRDLISEAVIVLLIILFAASASRKPRVLQYRLDRRGLTIGDRFYPYAMFKSFSLVQEGAFTSISLLPLKRLMLPINIYYEPKDESRIIEVISAYLPFERRNKDALDRFAHLIRF